MEPLRCAYLTAASNIWFQDVVVACPDLECHSLNPTVLGLREAPNPYALPEIDRVGIALVDTHWYRWLAQQGRETLQAAFRRLEGVSDVIIGLEPYDTFRLGAPPDMLDRCAGLVKAQGVYKDRDLYNYDVGPYFPGVVWTAKSRPSTRTYTSAQLEKLEVSLPCFLAMDPHVRAKLRRVHPGVGRFVAQGRTLAESMYERITALGKGSSYRHRDVSFVGALSHIQRRDLVIALDEAGVPGTFGITSVPDYVFGLKTRGTEPLTSEEQRTLVTQLERAGLLVKRTSRLQAAMIARRHGIGLGVTGYGEVTFRHAEAWRDGAALISQDLSHAEIMYPLTDERNVVFCRPDLGDLVALVRELQGDDARREEIGRRGRQVWKEWTSRADALMRQGLVEPIQRIA